MVIFDIVKLTKRKENQMKLSEKAKTLVMAGVLAIAGVGAVMMPKAAYAECVKMENGDYWDTVADTECDEEAYARDAGANSSTTGQIQSGMNATGLNGGSTANLETVVKRIINTALYIIGILAVVMMILGGIQYTTSAGEQAQVTKAKNTILYGLVGLIIAVLAYAIVNFVIGRLIA